MKRVKVKSKKGTDMEVLSYDGIAKMFYCYVPHLDLNSSIHPYALDLDEKAVDTLKQEMLDK